MLLDFQNSRVLEILENLHPLPEKVVPIKNNSNLYFTYKLKVPFFMVAKQKYKEGIFIQFKSNVTKWKYMILFHHPLCISLRFLFVSFSVITRKNFLSICCDPSKLIKAMRDCLISSFVFSKWSALVYQLYS